VSTPISKATLDYRDVYPCPICRHGDLSALLMTEAFSCNFCRHIFTANIEENTVRVEDSSQPLNWRWNGRSWQSVHRDDIDLTIVLWIIGAVLFILPASLVHVICDSIHPPLAAVTSLVWFTLTLLCHTTLVLWLLAEHYHFPPYVSGKAQFRTWLDRRADKR
jgi:hypothetical protein